MKIKIKKSFRLFGIIVFGFILYNSDYSLLVSNLSSIKLEFILYALFTTPIFFIIKIFRWYFLLNNIGFNYSFKNSIITFGAGLYAGQVTPGQVGELTRGVFLGNRGYNYSLAIQSVILDRILDIILLLILAIPGVVLFFNVKIKTFILIIVFSFVLIALFSQLVKILHKKFRFRIISWMKKLISKILKSSESFIKGLVNYKVGLILIFLTITALFINFARFYLIALSLDINFHILYFIFGTSFAMFVGLLPISILGIGTREAAYIIVFNNIGLSNELAISYSFMILIICYFFNILWGFPAWLMETK